MSRYKFDIKRSLNIAPILIINEADGNIIFNTNTSNGAPIRLMARFMTVHRAKGLESDIIILLNCNSGKYGFLSQISDDPVLNLLHSDADKFENGEERRLFYVALTRAKESIFMISERNSK